MNLTKFGKQFVKLQKEKPYLFARDNNGRILGWYFGSIVEVDEVVGPPECQSFKHYCVAYSGKERWLQHEMSGDQMSNVFFTSDTHFLAHQYY